MKKITLAALIALSFATGFTCSKNAPEQTATTTTETTTTAPATQEQMAAAPASADATMAQPATETK